MDKLITKMEQEILRIITKYSMYKYTSIENAYREVGKSFDLLLKAIEVAGVENISLYRAACSTGE